MISWEKVAHFHAISTGQRSDDSIAANEWGCWLVMDG